MEQGRPEGRSADQAEQHSAGSSPTAPPAVPNSRGTQIFINYKDNSFLDAQGFVPFGQVVEGMEVVDMLNAEYGSAPRTRRDAFRPRATSSCIANFPKLDYIKTATVVK